MRNIATIETVLRIIIVLVVITFSLEVIHNWLAFGILVILDVGVLYWSYHHTKSLISKGDLVVIRHKKSKWPAIVLRAILAVSILITLALSIEGGFRQEFNSNLILIAYVGFSGSFNVRQRGDFMLDSKGIIQPEIHLANYQWNQILNFRVEGGYLKFRVACQDRSFEIDDDKKLEIEAFQAKREAQTDLNQ
ncbi:MAG: hypothetical protein JKY54_10070 [Flavobacteriales bacterium]|nr:hypothetical protein [Flavobacteriales bacterium]